ncbi:MAG TPA: MltR family transcriptional regulator [Nitrososphaera sp.]|jgi:DNA-binding MltR family transcriptional regulator|nr:MltR family transcriptional regulator [Nitrososphaera sp.]
MIDNPQMFVPENLENVMRFAASLTSESDRGCALMAAAYLDSELGKLLDKFFVNNASVKREMLDQSRPLASFSARIDMAYLLGLLGPKAHRDLHLIRKVRNEFGHVPVELNFDDQGIRNRCGELYHDGYVETVSPRDKFIRTVIGVLAAIHVKLFKTNALNEADDLVINDTTREGHKKLMNEILKSLDAKPDA